MPELFTVYYMNQEKVFEMRMLLDNQITTSGTNEKSSTTSNSLALDGEAHAKVPFLTQLKGNLCGELGHEKRNRIVDTLEYINTKSRLLFDVIGHCTVFDDSKTSEGELVYIPNVKLTLLNEVEVRNFIPVMTGTFDGISFPEAGGLDIGHMLQSIIRTGASFKLRGQIAGGSNVLLKIPIQENDLFENRYSIDDLLIGHVDVIGICKGAIKQNELRSSYEYFQEQSSGAEDTDGFIDGSTSQQEKSMRARPEDSEEATYIDILAIIQSVRTKQGE